ncbi:MAG: hypothetical protein GY847_18735 [Proteobacteria bacterium]|nr:hypothetical protein [Pseudomonadota bacterium]
MKNLFVIVAAFFLNAACGHEIGDDCQFDVDCSQNMDRNCDSSQPGGYCLIIGCGPDECPGEAVCVEFTSPCPSSLDTTDAGIKEEEAKCRMIEPNRGRTYCLKHCKSDGSCRKKYDCVDPASLEAAIIDFDTKKKKVCVPELPESDV